MTTATASPKAPQRLADRIFSGSSLVAGILILVALAAVAIFLVAQSIPALVADPKELKGEPESFWAYVAPLVFGTMWAAFLALLIALPLSLGIALFISHYAPRRVAQGLGYIIACGEYEDAETAAVVKGYISYLASAEGQAEAASSAGAAPLSADLAAKVATAIATIK